MSDEKPYVGDVGTIIDIDVQEDVSAGTAFRFNVKKGDGSAATWTPTLQADKRTLRYTTLAADLNVAGDYIVQVSLSLGTWSGRCDPVTFHVYSLFE